MLRHLREHDLAQALAAFAQAVDAAPTTLAAPDDGLSAAAGGLYRALAQLDAGERYGLLYEWTLPTDTRKTVRLGTTVVSQVAPPKAFARVLGERPRDESFPISRVGEIRGLFSTGWLLVRAADEAGRLRRLTSELEQLAAERVPNADALLLLARLANARSDVTELAQLLDRHAGLLRDAQPPPGDGDVAAQDAAHIHRSSIVVAAAASTHAALRPISEDMFASLVEWSRATGATQQLPFLRLAHATAVQLHRGASPGDALRRNRLKYWVPASGRNSELSAQGAPDAVWLAHDNHVLHLAGALNDVLFFRYPLAGDFEFHCEVQQGGRMGSDGGLVYGGLHLQPLVTTSQLAVWDADMIHGERKPCRFWRVEDRPVFNRLSMTATNERVVFAVNGHPLVSDAASAANGSPWLGLRSLAADRPMFRNVVIRGKPLIPREVPLTASRSLRGWQSRFYGETQPSVWGNGSKTTAPRPVAPSARGPGEGSAAEEVGFQPASGDASPPATEFDWVLSDGVIYGRQREPAPHANPQSRLYYQRPLLDGESVRYEFHYQPEKVEVHPALGRLAFLLEPDGVRIHWMTDGAGEWSGLPVDNALLEPLQRRGPRRLPLRSNDWNSVVMARDAGAVTISLNRVVVYQRSIDYGGDHTFGFFRDPTRSAARIRNVVLSGDWPKALPRDLSENPVAVED